LKLFLLIGRIQHTANNIKPGNDRLFLSHRQKEQRQQQQQQQLQQQLEEINLQSDQICLAPINHQPCQKTQNSNDLVNKLIHTTSHHLVKVKKSFHSNNTSQLHHHLHHHHPHNNNNNN